MKSFKIYSKIIILSPLVILVILINYYLDPANLFKHGSYEKGIAAILLSGKNAANIKNYDERIFNKYYINNLKSKKNIVVLGSSRSMQINEDFFEGSSFFNNSVSGATIQDFMAIYDLYYSRELLPDTIILGLEPWLLNKNNNQKRWQSLRSNYKKTSNRAIIKNWDFLPNLFEFEKFLQLISPVYFQESLAKLNQFIKSDRSNLNYFATEKEELPIAVKLADGSLIYEEKTRLDDRKEVDKLVASYKQSNPIYSLGNYKKLDKNLIERFEKFVYLMHSDGVKVLFFIPPYHPDIYEYFSKEADYQMVKHCEDYFRKFADKNNIEVIGSFDPTSFSNDSIDFYDGMHPRERLVKSIFQNKVSNNNIQLRQ